MINETARADLAELIESGIQPTPEEVIALNDFANRMSLTNDRLRFYVRRSVRIGDLTFREPTVAHLAWIEQVEPSISMDGLSGLFVRTFCEAHAAAELPDPQNLALVSTVIGEWANAIANLPPQLVMSSDLLAWYGVSSLPRLTDEVEEEGRAWSFELAAEATVLMRISLAEASAMTPTELIALIREARRIRGEQIQSDSVGDYYKYLEKIKSAHSPKEK